MLELVRLFWVFSKIGLLSWGGGIVIVPLVETDVVWKYQWLTQREFVDAITLGQVSPGPVIISATFIGYKVAGFLGAVVATSSVILPSFILICVAAQVVRKFQDNLYLMGFFKGARAAVIGMVFAAALSIGRTSIVDIRTGFILVISLIILTQCKLNPIWILLAAAGIGVVT